MEEQPNQLLTIKLDGKVVAEATLVIYDAASAWLAFQESFAMLSSVIVGEFFNTMRVACHEDLKAERGPQGIMIDLNMGPKPTIYVPESNGHGLRTV